VNREEMSFFVKHMIDYMAMSPATEVSSPTIPR
jgi:hypothetical protein